MVKENAEKILNLIKQNEGLVKSEVFTEPNIDVQKLIDLILSECRCSITDNNGNYIRFGSSTDIRVIRMLIQIFISNEKEIPAEIVSMALTKEGVIGPLKKVQIEKRYDEEKDCYELDMEEIFPNDFYVSIFSENLEVKEKFIKNILKPYVKNIIFENDLLMNKCPGAVINRYITRFFKKQKTEVELLQNLTSILKSAINTNDELIENIANYIYINIMSNKYFKDELVNRTIHTTELQKIGRVTGGFGSLVDSMAYEVLKMLELRSFPYGEISSIKNTFYATVAVLESLCTELDNKNEQQILESIKRINRFFSHKDESKYRTAEANSNKFGVKTEFVEASDIEKALKNVCVEIVNLLQHKDELEIKEYLKESTRIHYRLVKIQPFEGANGRTARAVLNVLLIQKGMMGIFRKENRGEYIEYINEANRIINENEKQYLQGLCGNVEECNCYENEFLKNEFPALFVRI